MTDVNIIGNSYNDFVLYLGRIIICLGKKLLIRDMTRRHVFSASLSDIRGLEPEKEVIDYQGLGYTYGERNGRYGFEDGCDFDICLRLYDSDMLPDYSCGTIIVTDESKQSVDSLSDMDWRNSGGEGCFTLLVIRNYTGAVRSQFDRLFRNQEIKKVYPVPINQQDARCAVLAEYKDIYKFSSLSAVYREALTEIAALVYPEISSRELQRACRQAEKGGGPV